MKTTTTDCARIDPSTVYRWTRKVYRLPTTSLTPLHKGRYPGDQRCEMCCASVLVYVLHV
eukprot:5069652-Amphidinium_carterae.1